MHSNNSQQQKPIIKRNQYRVDVYFQFVPSNEGRIIHKYGFCSKPWKIKTTNKLTKAFWSNRAFVHSENEEHKLEKKKSS